MKCKKSIMFVNCGEKKEKVKKTVRSVIPFLSKLECWMSQLDSLCLLCYKMFTQGYCLLCQR